MPPRTLFTGQIAAGEGEAEMLRFEVNEALLEAPRLGALGVEWGTPTTLTGMFEHFDLVGFAVTSSQGIATSLLASYLYARLSRRRPSAILHASESTFKITIGNCSVLLSKVERRSEDAVVVIPPETSVSS